MAEIIQLNSAVPPDTMKQLENADYMPAKQMTGQGEFELTLSFIEPAMTITCKVKPSIRRKAHSRKWMHCRKARFSRAGSITVTARNLSGLTPASLY